MIHEIIEKIGAEAINLGVVAPVSEDEFQRQVKIIFENQGDTKKILELLESK